MREFCGTDIDVSFLLDARRGELDEFEDAASAGRAVAPTRRDRQSYILGNRLGQCMSRLRTDSDPRRAVTSAVPGER